MYSIAKKILCILLRHYQCLIELNWLNGDNLLYSLVYNLGGSGFDMPITN